MANELIKLTRNSVEYILSEVSRKYNCGFVFEGSVSRAVTGRVNVRTRAQKTVHNLSWDALTWDTAPDGGLGVDGLRALVYMGGVFSMIINQYKNGSQEAMDVVIDPESFRYELVPVRGLQRRIWRASLTLLEV